MTPHIIAGFAVGLLACAAYSIGYLHGKKRGTAEGWLERNQQALDDEKARRGIDGKFRRRCSAVTEEKRA